MAGHSNASRSKAAIHCSRCSPLRPLGWRRRVADVFGAAVDTIVRWRRDAIAWVRECCGAEPDAWQLEPLAAASKAQQLAIVGSKGCGKTTVLAWIILWFLSTRPLANIAATSISSDNLRDGLWKELALWIH